MDLRVKIQPKEIFIYSMYNFWAGLRGIGCIILTVLVIIAAAASEERLGTRLQFCRNRKIQSKGRALSQLAVYFNGSVMGFHNGFCQRQAQPDALCIL